jgi:hypothetical protein
MSMCMLDVHRGTIGETIEVVKVYMQPGGLLQGRGAQER